MIKRTLIAIAVVALLVTTSHAAITQFNFESISSEELLNDKWFDDYVNITKESSK